MPTLAPDIYMLGSDMSSVEEERAEGGVRKRPRAARACDFCRSKKYRCDEQDACSRCIKARIPCVYRNAEPHRRRARPAASTHHGLTSMRDASDSAASTHHATDDWTAAASTHDTIVDSGAASTHTCSPRRAPADTTERNDVTEVEITEINPHTLSTEFHGNTSSLAFLATLQGSAANGSASSRTPADLHSQGLVSTFHNDSFSPKASPNTDSLSLRDSKYHFRQSHYFLDGFFQNIHFIHPFIDRSAFLAKCENLWFGRHESQTRGFVALYFAVMSLGALTREWSEDHIDGLGRWEWSRKLFQLASSALGPFPVKTDLETVQASIIMAKVCQNELCPSLAYTYLGLAVRASLSAGHNRNPSRVPWSDHSIQVVNACKTWWALYSIEVELSFALGRPDSLGSDLYHNCTLPPVEDSETGIISLMVEFARIVRKIPACVDSQATTVDERILSAAEIEADLENWVASLPAAIRPRLGEPTDDIGAMKDPAWAKKQRHTLRFRYYNAIMVLYRPYLLRVKPASVHRTVDRNGRRNDALSKCVAAAEATIRLMHHMYSTASYFRTWWYNTTYTLYAASIILGYRTRLAPADKKLRLQQLIDMSIEILHAMDENVVAKKAADLLRTADEKAQDRYEALELSIPSAQEGTSSFQFSQNNTANLSDPFGAVDVCLNPLEENSFEFMAQLFAIDGRDFPF